MICIALDIEKVTKEPNIIVQFDTDIDKPHKVETWTPSLERYVDCTEIFQELYRLHGYWHEKVQDAVREYYESEKVNRELDDDWKIMGEVGT